MMDMKTMLLVNQLPQSSLVSHRNAVFLTLWEMFTVRLTSAHAFAEVRILFSTKGAQYAFGEADQDGEERSSRWRRSTSPSSTLCRSKGGSISYAIRPL